MALLQPFNKISLCKSLILVTLVSSPFTLLAADKMIDLTVHLNGTSYKLEFTNSECPGKPNDMGCIEVERGNAPMIFWELDEVSSQNWKLTSLQLSPDGQHWGEHGYPLKDCTMEDFDLSGDDDKTGDASKAQVISNGKKLMVRDHNKQPHTEGCLTHYKLFAEHRTSGDEINSDPIIDNRGR